MSFSQRSHYSARSFAPTYNIYAPATHGQHQIYIPAAPAPFQTTFIPSGEPTNPMPRGAHVSQSRAFAQPPQHPCDQCHSDTIIEFERQKIPHWHRTDIIPEPGLTAPPGNGPSAVVFESKEPGPGGVLVTDILAFRDCLEHSGAHVLRHTPGPVYAILTVGNKTFEERIPGNCEHRPITCFNLAWWLAKYLQNDLKDKISGLYLLSLFTRDGNTWTANARYSNRTVHSP
ncbi:hypothetical protein DFH07DRAFT_999093 [Mycena maculata]|uniref:Uncharacterized protein n=1 Tax=Mycena maculata TaxID=230809 RepID=A0AAD7HTQ8_9AGAR|nr:hypothetical protein DFH07DRAFT_999093 [Mycena maculata]